MHLSAGRPPLVRRGGELEALGDEALDADDLRRMLAATLDAEQRARLARDFHLDFIHPHRGPVRFAARCFHDTSGLAAVLRLMPHRAMSLEELGCPEVARRACERQRGLVLCVGPRGSGKTVTMAALVEHLNQTKTCRAVSIDRPIEIQHGPGSAQIIHREVGLDSPSFADAIRCAGRDDVEVVIVGDLCGRDAIQAALDVASAGALVIAGVLGRGAAPALEALLSVFSSEDRPRARAELADTLAAVVALELLPRADRAGVVTAYEVLLGSAALGSMIRDDRGAEIVALMQAGAAVGMQTMDGALERLASRGIIRTDDALARAVDRDALLRALGRRAPSQTA